MKKKIILMFAFCLAFSSAIYAESLSVWLNDENVLGKVVDEIGVNDFILAGGAAAPVFTNDTPFSYSGNKSLYYGGDGDRMYINTMGTLALTNKLTIEAWIKGGDNGSDGAPTYRVILGNYTTYGLIAMEQDSGVNPKFGFAYRQSEANRVAFFTNTGSATLDDGEWHHIAASFDASNNEIILYVDGTVDSVQQATGTGVLDYVNYVFRTGSDAAERWYKGLIDECRVSDAVLAPHELGFHKSFGLKKK